MPIPVTTGLQLLIHAGELPVVADGTSISSATDQSAQGNDAAQATSARQPIYKTNIFASGMPAIRFAGTDDSLFGSFADWTATSGMTVILAMANFVSGSSAPFGGFCSLHGGSGDDFGSDAGLCITRNSSATNSMQVNKSGGSPTRHIGPIDTDPFIYGYGTSTDSQLISGGLRAHTSTTAALGVAAATGYVLGNRYLSGSVSTTTGAAFDLGLVVVYDRLITNGEFASVGRWLSEETGIISAGGGTSFTGIIPSNGRRLGL